MSFSIPPFYHIALRHSHYAVKNNSASAENIKTAKDIILLATQYDINKARKFECVAYAGKKVPYQNPQEPYFIATSTIGYEWSDGKKPPSWHDQNKGFRRNFSGITYGSDKHGYPINPYNAYHQRLGRGILALWGPNQTVTNGVVIVKSDKLHVYGIQRRDDYRQALSGGYTKHLKKNTSDFLRNPIIYESQTDEFFEEMLSGSVHLTPQYEALAQLHIKERVAAINCNRDAEKLPCLNNQEEKRVKRHVETEKKLDMVRENDPALLRELNHRFANSNLIYAGPMVASKANRRNAWVETYFSWFEMNKDEWEDIQSKCHNRYEISAGDDAISAGIYEITPDLIENASGSHSSYFAYLMAHYLISGKDITQAMTGQSKEIKRYLELSL